MTANAGYHLFNTGDVLTASQVQFNLQNQTIMYFASSAARTSALSGVVVEGMFSYLADTNSTEYYDGAAWQSISNPGDITGVSAGNGLSGGGTSGAVSLAIDTAITVDKTTAQTLTNKTLTSPALTTPTISTATTNGDLLYGTGSGALSRLGIGSTGNILTVAGGIPSWSAPAGGSKVVQIVYAKTNTSVTMSTTTWTDTNLTATITPTSASNEVLIMFQQNGYYKSNGNLNNRGELQLLVGATALDQYANYQSYTGSTIENLTSLGGSFVHSPATTSATTYKTQFRNGNASADVRINFNGIYSTIILMEVTP